ncbi:TRM82 tRNA [Candida maltosa Xu316]
MTHPYQILTSNKEGTHIYVVVKNYLQVFDIASGKKLGEWQDPVKSDHHTVQYERRTKREIKTQQITNDIKYMLLTRDETYVLASTDADKSVLIFAVDFTQDNCLSLIKRQPMPKRPCSLALDDNNNVVLADKFGDVYTVGIDANEPKPEKEFEPICGHVSMLTDVIVAKHGGKEFVLTGDRDEHIRVSNYPKSYVIKQFLFGHKEFLSQLYIPAENTEILVSGGGDDFVNVWKWYENKLVGSIDIKEHVGIEEPAIKKITSFKNDDKHLLLLFSENTPKLLVYSIKDDGFEKIEYQETITTESSIVDFTIAKNTLIISTESELVYYDLQANKLTEGPKFTDSIPFDSFNAETLYTIHNLRKRSEFS